MVKKFNKLIALSILATLVASSCTACNLEKRDIVIQHGEKTVEYTDEDYKQKGIESFLDISPLLSTRTINSITDLNSYFLKLYFATEFGAEDMNGMCIIRDRLIDVKDRYGSPEVVEEIELLPMDFENWSDDEESLEKAKEVLNQNIINIKVPMKQYYLEQDADYVTDFSVQ